ncbi:hypothetical protein [Rubripirellula reticaptiva]|uniref:hypothetical protein n=1 Tax=Rubripirellula reticaptiva TaxID=2528013 RepID=UPI0011B634BA|nr:hypothetical protein [Rubripirellula reticaptiva]
MTTLLTITTIALVICSVCTLVVAALIRRAPLIESSCENGPITSGIDDESDSTRPVQRRLQLRSENRSPVLFVPALSAGSGGRHADENDSFAEQTSAWTQPIPR